jgi:peptidoglycan/xylan/chitin deacetylase (PgdA/CDA1 family)
LVREAKRGLGRDGRGILTPKSATAAGLDAAVASRSRRLGPRIGVRAAKAAAGMAAAAPLVHALPSVAVLGQYTGLRHLPFGLVIWRGASGRPAAALTFDDGPEPGSTEATLDLLDELGARATFFVLGQAVERSPELVEEILRRGHGIGTHGYAHRSHLLRSPSWVLADLERSLEALGALGASPRFFRPPYGHVALASLVAARRFGLKLALWSVWAREWRTIPPAAVVRAIEPALAPGAVVLLHDNEVSCPPGTAARTRAALPGIAEAAAARGLALVRLDELLADADDGDEQRGVSR